MNFDKRGDRASHRQVSALPCWCVRHSPAAIRAPCVGLSECKAIDAVRETGKGSEVRRLDGLNQ